MGKLPVFHKKPFILSGVLALLALALFALGWHQTETTQSLEAMSFFAIGGFLLLAAVVIALLFGLHEKQFRRTMSQPLMVYTLDKELMRESIDRNASEIKGKNILALIVMLFFCGLIAIAGLFLGEDGRTVSLIMLVLALFLVLACWIITTVRVKGLKKTDGRVLISQNGVFFLGRFHTWALPGGRIDLLMYEPAKPGTDQHGVLHLKYALPALYKYNSAHLHILVPANLEKQARATVEKIKDTHQLKV
jgi:hypothetical protein